MVSYRTFLVLGLAVGTLGAGYIFAPQPGGATVATAPVPKAAPVATAATPAAPTAKPASSLVANRAPVPLQTRPPTTYFVPKGSAAPGQTASATTGATATDISKARAKPRRLRVTFAAASAKLRTLCARLLANNKKMPRLRCPAEFAWRGFL